MTIKAIETEYGGVLFRSRLEARWAVFFDALQIEWRYEDEAYTFQEWNYLPDFYLPKYGTFVEVKGDANNVTTEYLYMLGHAGHMLPGVHNSASHGPTTKGLLLLGNVPRADAYENVYHLHLSHYKGLIVQTWSFGRRDAEVHEWEPYIREIDNTHEYAVVEHLKHGKYGLWDARTSDYWQMCTSTYYAYEKAWGYRFWNPRAA